MALIMLRAGKNDFVILCAYTAMLASIGSRASETAALTFEHLEVLKYTNDYQHCDLFQVELCRDKTIHTQKPRIFPMAYDNNWFKDIYFMLALLMIYRCVRKYQETVIEDTSPIFPKFYEESKKEKKKADKKDSKGNSLVSKFLVIFIKKLPSFLIILILMILFLLMMQDLTPRLVLILAKERLHNGLLNCVYLPFLLCIDLDIFFIL